MKERERACVCSYEGPGKFHSVNRKLIGKNSTTVPSFVLISSQTLWAIRENNAVIYWPTKNRSAGGHTITRRVIYGK